MSKNVIILLSIIFWQICIVSPSFSQQKDSIIIGKIDEITLVAPMFISSFPCTYQNVNLNKLDKSQNSLKFVLDRQMGLQAFNGENFAQDIRISIRGYGARSAFGVRGIRIYMDEIPLTSPDGTSQLDEVSIYDLASLEIIRSGISGRFGNASGGAIAFNTKTVDEPLFIQATSRVNSFGSLDFGIKYGLKTEKTSNLFSINHHNFNSKREFSRSATTSIYNKYNVSLSKNLDLKLIGGLYHSPIAEDPGSLTLEQLSANPYQANARNLLFKAGESVSGGHIAAKLVNLFKDNFKYQTTLFYRNRNFNGRLPFEDNGYINLIKNFMGLENTIQYYGVNKSQLILGHSIQYQDDHRKTFKNLEGKKGVQLSNQNEKVLNNALFQQLIWKHRDFSLNQLLRYDLITYKLKDNYEDDGIQDGSRTFSSVNGSLGISYKLGQWSDAFANFSSSFEMPTLNELTNNPDGTTSFNPELSPEKSIAIEIGWKSKVNKRLNWTINLFQIFLKDQIQSYELPTLQGKSFYRNASKTNRQGLEISLGYIFSKNFTINTNYQFSHFYFGNYVSGLNDFTNNIQPIIPTHKFNLFLDHHNNYFECQFLAAFNDSMWLDDANTTKSKSYFDFNLMVSTNLKFSKSFTLGFQLNNFLNTVKYSNFRANAISNRYYEAASPSNLALFFNYQFVKK